MLHLLWVVLLSVVDENKIYSFECNTLPMRMSACWLPCATLAFGPCEMRCCEVAFAIGHVGKWWRCLYTRCVRNSNRQDSRSMTDSHRDLYGGYRLLLAIVFRWLNGNGWLMGTCLRVVQRSERYGTMYHGTAWNGNGQVEVDEVVSTSFRC